MDKSEYYIVSGLCCENAYLDTAPKACGAGEAECLCCATDYVLCGELDYVPKMCSLLPGCVVMPKFGCCKTFAQLTGTPVQTVTKTIVSAPLLGEDEEGEE